MSSKQKTYKTSESDKRLFLAGITNKEIQNIEAKNHGVVLNDNNTKKTTQFKSSNTKPQQKSSPKDETGSNTKKQTYDNQLSKKEKFIPVRK